MRAPKAGFVSALMLAAAIGVLSTGPASACSLAQYGDDGRYVGGDLIAQIAEKADQIDIVVVSNRYLVRRSFTQGGWYLNFGTLDVPDDRPEFTDAFVFSLETVEVLKPNRRPRDFLYEQTLRIAGYDTGVWGEVVVGEAGPDAHFNSLPPWLLERPGHDGYAFIGASDDNGLGSGECTTPYLLEVGQSFVALRDSIGRLYPASGGFPLEIEAEFRLWGGGTREATINMQSLIPISGPDDPFLIRLRQALTGVDPDQLPLPLFPKPSALANARAGVVGPASLSRRERA